MKLLPPLMALAAFAAPSIALAQASPSPFTNATRYDAMRRVTGTISADPDGVGTGNPFIAVRNSYDAAGQLIKVETGTLSAWQSEAVVPLNWGAAFNVARTLETSYDAMERKIRDTLREGPVGPVRTVTQYSYDIFGRLECTAVRMNPATFGSLPASACNHSTYDPALGYDRISRTIYDAAGQRLQLREGVGTTDEGTEATWAYNLNGQVTTVIDGNGNRATLTYDGHGRQIRWTFPSTTRPGAFNDVTPATALASAGSVNAADYEGYSYDPNGNRTNLRTRDTRNIVFAYDALNRVTSKTYPQGGATPVHYGYNLQGLQRLARYNSPTGEGVTNVYDGFGRVASQSINMGGVTRTLSYQYDRNGNRTRLTWPDGFYASYSYDGLGRPFGMLENGVSGLVQFTWNPQGQVSRRAQGAFEGTDFTYDVVGRPASLAINLAATSHDSTWAFGRNAASQLSSITRSNDTYAWTSHYAVNRPYTTDGLNRYSVAGSATFLYDINGNLTSDGSRTYTYDIENRLIGASGGLTLTYDPLGRLHQTSGGPSGTTRFLYDGDALVAEFNASGTLTRRHVHAVGADVPTTTYESGARRYLYADHQGSIIVITDSAGAAIAINRYDEYGIPAGTNSGRFQYTGQIWLSDLGMYHYKARIYSPTLGRFLQVDPIGYEDQYNLYAYVGNDPVNATDPTGNEEEREEEERENERNNDEGCGSHIRGVNSPACSGGSLLAIISRFNDATDPRNIAAHVVSLLSFRDVSPEQVRGDIDSFLESPLRNTADVLAAIPGGRAPSAGLRGVAASRGLIAGTLTNITGRRAITNLSVRGTIGGFASGLTRRGFTSHVSRDGRVQIFRNGNTQYILRSHSRHGAPTAEYWRNGRRLAEIRIVP